VQTHRPVPDLWPQSSQTEDKSSVGLMSSFEGRVHKLIGI